MVSAAQHGRRTLEVINPEFGISSALSEEQRQAVAELLGSRNLVTIFRGGAGTGKSFTLKEISRGIAAAKREVTMLAPRASRRRIYRLMVCPRKPWPCFSPSKNS